MDIIEFSDRFYNMEQDLDLFQIKIDGISWWDVVRHDVFYEIYYGLNGLDINPSRHRSLTQRATSLFKYLLKRAKFLISIQLFNHDVIALSAPRNYTGNKRRDIILDEILECIPSRKLIIETVPLYYHISQRKKLYYKDPDPQYVGLNDEVKKRFGRKLDVESLIEDRLQRFYFTLVEYTKLLDKVNPKFVILIQNGIEKALFHAANMKEIPTIEAQHGLIGYVHPAYSYPKQITQGSLSTLPTYFLSFSRHWTENCDYPVKRSIVCGNSSLSVKKTTHSHNAILVISGPSYEDPLEKILMPAAKQLCERKFIYKLHPNQYARHHEISKRFLGLRNVEIVCGEKTISQLIEKCSSALCVQSTAVYEMLQAGMFVNLVKTMDYRTHADIIDHASCKIVSTPDTFINSVLKETTNPIKKELSVYFEKFNRSNVSDLVKRLSK